MLYLHPDRIPQGIEVAAPFGPRKITHAFHDIDGTHSLIREWVPVMTLVTGFVSVYGLPAADTPEQTAEIIAAHTPSEFPEGHRFSLESAGLSALTRMEWALRRAFQNSKLVIPGVRPEINDRIVARIWQGEEEFPDCPEPEAVRDFLASASSRLFRSYELLLAGMGRDRNLEAARRNPEAWRIPGSPEFLQYLHLCGVRNYFVTGAVIEYDEAGCAHGKMADEIAALQLTAHPGSIVEKLIGSTWHEKLPKEKIMLRICREEAVDPADVLVVGDGRSEIAAAAAMGALAMSRLNSDAVRAREIHRGLGTNLIVEKYELDKLRMFMCPEKL